MSENIKDLIRIYKEEYEDGLITKKEIYSELSKKSSAIKALSISSIDNIFYELGFNGRLARGNHYKRKLEEYTRLIINEANKNQGYIRLGLFCAKNNIGTHNARIICAENGIKIFSSPQKGGHLQKGVIAHENNIKAKKSTCLNELAKHKKITVSKAVKEKIEKANLTQGQIIYLKDGIPLIFNGFKEGVPEIDLTFYGRKKYMYTEAEIEAFDKKLKQSFIKRV